MRAIVVVMLAALASGCSGNPAPVLAPHEPGTPLFGVPLVMELDVSVIDSLGEPIEGAEVILQAEPAPRRVITPASGTVRFVGVFTVAPRMLIVCAPEFACSAWIDRESPGSSSLHQLVTLQRLADQRIRFDVQPPSSEFITYVEGERVRISIPSNWRELPGTNAVTFAPDGAYGNVGVKSVFTHGLAMSLERNDKRNVLVTTDDFIESYVLAKPAMPAAFLYDNVRMGNRPGLHTVLASVSEATGLPEQIEIFTTLLDDDTLFYVVATAPRDTAPSYAPTFQRIVSSIEIIECDASRSSRASPGRPRPLGCPESRVPAAARRQ
ncbi:MAG TPA: hypothetical protein VFA59_22015 [Vicinamibacterales bacterium]|nr:hypothetical protein [Vicinamibacterales bacterium]